MLNSQTWKYVWVTEQDRVKPKYALWSVGYRIEWDVLSRQSTVPITTAMSGT